MNQDINLDIYTNRQLVEGCLEKLYDIIKKTIQAFIDGQMQKTTNQQVLSDLKKSYNKDLLGMLSFFIQNYDDVIVFFNLGDRRLIRSRLFELKQARNDYAHNREYNNIRDVTRIYDTCLYLFDDLGMDQNYETYKLISFIRNQLIIKEAKQIYNQQQNNNQQNQFQNNMQNFIPPQNHLNDNNYDQYDQQNQYYDNDYTY